MRPNEVMEYLFQQLPFLFEQNRLLLMLLAVLATGMIVMMGAIAAFLVGWCLRQDRKIATLSEKAAKYDRDLSYIDYYMRETIPELYDKFDAIICGKYPNNVDKLVATVKNALLGSRPEPPAKEEPPKEKNT